MSARSSRMARATFASPTGARTNRAPRERAASSTTRLVDRLTTTVGISARSDASVQHSGHCKSQGVVLAYRPAGFIDQREPVHVGIDGQARSSSLFPGPDGSGRRDSPELARVDEERARQGSRLIPWISQPRRSSSGTMAVAPAPRTQSNATLKCLFLMALTST